jgi:hypothetical protein
MAEGSKNIGNVEKASKGIVTREKQPKLKSEQISKKNHFKTCPLEACDLQLAKTLN